MIRTLKHIYYAVAYYISWGLFMGVGFLISVLSLPLYPWRKRGGLHKKMRAVQRVLFRVWMRWFRACGVVRITWKNFDGPLAPGTVYISTHPCLIDAPLLLGRLPDTICVVKPAIMRNPALGAAAIVAGYVTGSNDVDMVRAVAEKVQAGASLLIFPEGTRTEPGATLNPFKPGFALIANRAAAPVRLVIVRASAGFVTRGRPWWKIPDVVPATMELSLDREWPHDPQKSAAALSAEIESYVRGKMSA
ncbi:1-acyl-sn-glycerol-3-phosphate acyltransferase [Ereboglobus sp. PH5-5]|uniref:lysophospholipid acyltransferase family protein n=1 Tax=Ereboglobus sp. PH5-5 TaxID=2940529 RepID=UPI0024050BBE|nr:lysophospholipid acyltransferase family protein [Ereboglobus sp. PH5-5]MDF9833634.1 1-acyl-sn-glycerol-3-phosphate acyltransferase [Ereboglobus sp. PH5-5]